MQNFPLLSFIIFLPLLGAILVSLLGGQDADGCRAKKVALLTSVVNFVLSLFLLTGFQAADANFQFVEKVDWFGEQGVAYHLGVDGISLFFIMLSTFLTPVCILASWGSVKTRIKEYMIAFLVLETFMVGTFCALDGILFYVFFEGVLIPMFIIIGVWGGKRRVYSAYKLFLYTLLGSVLMLVGLLALYVTAGTTDMTALSQITLSPAMQCWLFIAFFASFAVKMPMWPVHTWLPDAHVEAPTAGSVILAGVLLKMGGYGFLRFSLPMFPVASEMFAPVIFGLSVIAVIYTSLIALVQEDMKKLIAYSSVAHMGFVTLGIFTFNRQGLDGAIFQMISHGIISAALFLCVGVVYDRLHTREISQYGGIAKNMPVYATVFMVLMLASVGLPGTSGFVGEFLTLLGAFQVSSWVTLLVGSGVVLGAAYMLVLYRRVLFGPQTNPEAAAMSDLTTTEYAYFLPFVVMAILFGVMPSYILDRIGPASEKVIAQYQLGLERAGVARAESESAVTEEGDLPKVQSPVNQMIEGHE